MKKLRFVGYVWFLRGAKKGEESGQEGEGRLEK